MFYPQKNVAHILVAKDLAQPSAGTIVENYASLTDGHVAVLGQNNAVLDGTSIDNGSNKYIKFVQRMGTSLLFSPLIEKAKIVSAKTVNYVAPVLPVHYIGYNGTSGSIEAINTNTYMARIFIRSNQKQFGNKQVMKFGVYKSDSSATQPEVAWGLLQNLIYNFTNEQLIKLQFDMVINTALDTAYDITNNVTVVKGLDYLDIATNLTYNTAAGTLAVGDYIRLALTNTTAALTNPVYKVVKIDSLRVYLDRPVVSASGTYTDAADSSQVIPAATAVSANHGIKVTALANDFKVGVWKYEVPKFEISLQDFGATTVTIATAAKDPVGYGALIQELQYTSQGNWGNKYRQGNPIPDSLVDAVATTGYNMLVIQYYGSSAADNMGSPINLPKELIIALPDGGSYDNALIDILQADSETAVFAAAAMPDFS